MPYRRRPGAYAAVDLQIKPRRNNPLKYMLPVADGKDRVGFGSSTNRFQPEDYYLENGEPGANSVFSPNVGRSSARDAQDFHESSTHVLPGEEKAHVRGWAGPDDAIKAKRGWCGGAHYSSFAPKTNSPLLEKGADLMKLSGNETRLHELQALRDRKLYQPPGPGSYELQGDIKPRSYRRPESGGPKTPVHGKSIRDVERERFWHAMHARVSSPGPGYYDTARAKDRTQTKKTQGPVGANFKQGYTRKAECLSVTMLTGHHWREHVAPLGQAGPAASKGATDKDHIHESEWAPSLRSPVRAQRPTHPPKQHSQEYQKIQALLDARLSKPKMASTAPHLFARVEPPQALLRMPETRSYSPAAWHWETTEPGSKIGFSRSTARDLSRSGHLYEDPARAPSAPPMENARRQGAGRSLRAEASDSFPLDQSPTGDLSRPMQTEAARAARTALMQEQMRMEWQIRSSHGVRLESSASSLYAVPIQWADCKVRRSHQ